MSPKRYRRFVRTRSTSIPAFRTPTVRKIWQKWRYSSPARKTSKISRTVLEIFQSFLYDRVFHRMRELPVFFVHIADLLQEDVVRGFRANFFVALCRCDNVGGGEFLYRFRRDAEVCQIVSYRLGILRGKNPEQLGDL